MNKRKIFTFPSSLLSGLLVAAAVWAMSSANYTIHWDVIGGVGGPGSSASYAENGTVGQTSIGASDSANYQLGAGFSYSMATTPTPTPRFLWGDLNADGVPGAVDAGLLLRYDVFLIDRFPGYPDIVFPDYPPAADLNGDGVGGAVDAGLLLRYDVFLILSFPADLDEDGYGPDSTPAGKMSSKKSSMSQQNDAGDYAPSAGRRLSASVEPVRSQESSKRSWVVNFSVDDAADIQGLRLALHYDPDVLKVSEDSAKWLVSDPGKELVTNAENDGLLLVSGALSEPLGHGTRELMSVRFERLSATDGEGAPITVRLDQQLIRINDGNIRIDPDSTSAIDLVLDTNVSDWMIYR